MGVGPQVVSSMLVALAARAQAGAADGDARPAGGALDPCVTALRPATELRAAVTRLWNRTGPASVFGFAAAQADLPFSPALYLLDTAGSVEILARRWRVAELAWGVRNLTGFVPDGPRAVRLEFLPDRGVPASPSQNLMICGAVAGLLHAQGHSGLHVSACLAGRWTDVADGVRWLPGRGGVDVREVTGYRLAWAADPLRWVPRMHLLAAEQVIGDPVVGAAVRAAGQAARQVTPLGLARAALSSPRTLDRRMAALGVSAGRVLRRARLRAATVAISTPGRSLSEIAHETGFSDAAHLSRTFRAAAGMTPSGYRRAATVY